MNGRDVYERIEDGGGGGDLKGRRRGWMRVKDGGVWFF